MKKLFLVWFFSLAILLGPAYNTYLNYDYKSNPDCETYMAIANGDFENQSLVRRYRIIVPFTAKVISIPIEKVYAKIWSNKTNDQGPLRLGFLLVNLFLMSTVGVTLFACCKAYGISDTGSLLAIIAILIGGRWGNLFAAAPLTDSLYLLSMCGTVYALKQNNKSLLAACIIIGPMAKESFVLVIPIILILSKTPKIQLLLFTLIAGVLAWSTRYWIDLITVESVSSSISTDLDHVNNVLQSIKRILSVRGLGELATVLGLFSILLLIGFTGGREHIKSWMMYCDKIVWWFIPVILIHALLSTEVARMLYFGSACWGIMLGLIWDNHPWIQKYKSSSINT